MTPTSAGALLPPRTAPIPYYVKHNPSSPQPTPTPKATTKATASAKATPLISVHLVPDSNSQYYIEYWITDSLGTPGEKHSKNNTDNESPNSTLFTARFTSATAIDVKPKGKEVIIQGTAADGQCHAWKSDAKHSDDHIPNDGDVEWKDWKCE